ALGSLREANDRLRDLGTDPDDDLDTLAGKARQAEARSSATDLAGYFNDAKLALEVGRSRSNSPDPAEIALDQLLDCLELAEQKGGIGHWLAQWNAMMRDPNATQDITRRADIAQSIRAGIEFQKEMLRELQGTWRGESVAEPAEAVDVPQLLDTIADEIARQSEEALYNDRFETASKLEAARNTLKRTGIRESTAERLRQATTE